MENVSVIIPAYNKAALTVQTVESVLNQTYPDIEIIVVDDGSTDETQEALSRFQGRIRYVHKENGGCCSARNLGIRLASGAYIAFLDCDDLYAEEKIAQCVRFLQENPQFGFVHTGAHFIDEHNDIVGQYAHRKSLHQGWIARRLILGNYICNSTVVARRGAVDTIGFYDESIFMPADWDFWLRLSERYQAGYIDRPLTHYRVSDNYIFDRLRLSQQEEEHVIQKFFKRNPRWGGCRQRALSNLHLRYAMCYFLQEDAPRFREEFRSSLKSHPLNRRAIYFLLYYLFDRNHLRGTLHKRILRTSP